MHARFSTGSLASDKLGTNFAVLISCLVLSGFIADGQISNPIPPPLTPGTQIVVNNAIGYLRVKASPDECWTGTGQNTRWDFINQSTPSQPCAGNQIPKVNQGYPWGMTMAGGQIYFGTFANPTCTAGAGATNPNPYQIAGAFACEFGQSPYAQANGGPLPPGLGDYRPPRMYVYNISTHTVKDITPTLGGSPPASVCGTTSPTFNGLCLDPDWNATLGIRSVTSYTESTTGKTYVIAAGEGLNGINFFAYGISEQAWVGKYSLSNYSSMRSWLNYNGVLYAAVFGPSGLNGSLLRYTGNFAVGSVPPSQPSAQNGYVAIPTCGTTSTAMPPTSSTGFCFAFQDVGDFNTPASEVVVAPAGTADAGRIFVGTWSQQPTPTNFAGIFMSPVVPQGGLTSANASQWTEVWNASQYDPDPVLSLGYGTGAMSFFNGYLYWGTLNPPFASVRLFENVYGTPSGQAQQLIDAINAERTPIMMRGQAFSTGAPQVQLLYGSAQLEVFHSPKGSTNGVWVQTKNNVPQGTCTTACGVAPLYGQYVGNQYTGYIWSMAVWNSELYVGTLNSAFLLAEQSALALPPSLKPQPSQFGAGLFYFPNTTAGLVPVSTNGVGNYLNYGVRNLVVNGTTSLFLGMANPMNLATSGNTNPGGGNCQDAPTCRGGIELIELTPGSTVRTR